MKKNRARSPLLWALIGVVGGIYLQSIINAEIPFFVVPGIVTVLTIFLALKSGRMLFLLVAIILTGSWFGAFLSALQTSTYQQTRAIFEGNNAISLQATVADIEPWPSVWKGKMLKLTIDNPTGTKEAVANGYAATCFFRHTDKTFRVGDKIQAINLSCKKEEKNDSSHTSSYTNYLLKEGVLFSCFLLTDEHLSLIRRPNIHLKRWLWEWRQAMYEKLEKILDKKTFKYLALIFLGNKKQDDIDTMRTVFNRWGLAHYLARAGLHIVIFIFLWTLLLRLIPIHLILKRIFLLLLCIFYDLLSWSSIPFCRAFYAFVFANMGLLSYRSVNTIHLLSLICMFILLFNPIQLFFLDFQLTFALTFLLLFL